MFLHLSQTICIHNREVLSEWKGRPNKFTLDSKSHLLFLVHKFQLDRKFCLRLLVHVSHQESKFLLDSRSLQKSLLESRDHMSHLSVGVLS